jgi:uncharacterized protein YabN with tetrapyrrole methylase and pyrophosphatase domain
VDTAAAVDSVVQVVAQLRHHCRWTAALTHESLLAYLIEESYELTDLVETSGGNPDPGELRGELADILYQVLLHARLQEEAGAFGLAEVANHLRAKLIRRNSHVFRPDGTLQDRFPDSIAEIEQNYAAAKAAEHSGSAGDGAPEDLRASVFGTLPASMPALALAAKTIERARAAGLDTGVRGGHAGGEPQTEDELGELLFAVVRSAQAKGLDAERALRNTIRQVHAGA